MTEKCPICKRIIKKNAYLTGVVICQKCWNKYRWSGDLDKLEMRLKLKAKW